MKAKPKPAVDVMVVEDDDIAHDALNVFFKTDLTEVGGSVCLHFRRDVSPRIYDPPGNAKDDDAGARYNRMREAIRAHVGALILTVDLNLPIEGVSDQVRCEFEAIDIQAAVNIPANASIHGLGLALDAIKNEKIDALVIVIETQGEKPDTYVGVLNRIIKARRRESQVRVIKAHSYFPSEYFKPDVEFKAAVDEFAKIQKSPVVRLLESVRATMTDAQVGDVILELLQVSREEFESLFPNEVARDALADGVRALGADDKRPGCLRVTSAWLLALATYRTLSAKRGDSDKIFDVDDLEDRTIWPCCLTPPQSKGMHEAAVKAFEEMCKKVFQSVDGKTLVLKKVELSASRGLRCFLDATMAAHVVEPFRERCLQLVRTGQDTALGQTDSSTAVSLWQFWVNSAVADWKGADWVFGTPSMWELNVLGETKSADVVVVFQDRMSLAPGIHIPPPYEIEIKRKGIWRRQGGVEGASVSIGSGQVGKGSLLQEIPGDSHAESFPRYAELLFCLAWNQKLWGEGVSADELLLICPVKPRKEKHSRNLSPAQKRFGSLTRDLTRLGIMWQELLAQRSDGSLWLHDGGGDTALAPRISGLPKHKLLAPPYKMQILLSGQRQVATVVIEDKTGEKRSINAPADCQFLALLAMTGRPSLFTGGVNEQQSGLEEGKSGRPASYAEILNAFGASSTGDRIRDMAMVKTCVTELLRRLRYDDKPVNTGELIIDEGEGQWQLADALEVLPPREEGAARGTTAPLPHDTPLFVDTLSAAQNLELSLLRGKYPTEMATLQGFCHKLLVFMRMANLSTMDEFSQAEKAKIAKNLGVSVELFENALFFTSSVFGEKDPLG